MANMYTKQQLTGGQVYDPKTRIGNCKCRRLAVTIFCCCVE